MRKYLALGSHDPTSKIADLMFERAPEAMLLVDERGVLVRANKRCESLFGYRREELLGRQFELLVAEGLRGQFATHGEKFIFEPNIQTIGAGLTLCALHKDGSEFPVNIKMSVIVCHGSSTVMAVIRDISESKLQERLAGQLIQQREDYVATLTHDLKTPILAAKRVLQLLIEGDFGAISEAQSEVLATILASNESMYELVRTLLDVYKYESGVKKLSLESHDLRGMLLDFVNELKPLAQSKAIAIQTLLPEEPVFVICDREEIRRVLQNLVDNAFKFTPRGGTVQLRIEQSNDRTTTAIADSGRGVSDHDQAQLFQRFWQAAQGARLYAGTGLGLYLCRKIVEHHGGNIWCESKVGVGSTFYFALASSK